MPLVGCSEVRYWLSWAEVRAAHCLCKIGIPSPRPAFPLVSAPAAWLPDPCVEVTRLESDMLLLFPAGHEKVEATD